MMVKTHFSEVSLLHYTEEDDDGEELHCFATEFPIQHVQWPQFASQIERTLALSGAYGVYRSGRAWKCTIPSRDQARKACLAVAELAAEWGMGGFSSNVFDKIALVHKPEKPLEEVQTPEEIRRIIPSVERAASVLLRDNQIHAKAMDINAGELGELVGFLERYAPGSGWRKMADKWIGEDDG